MKLKVIITSFLVFSLNAMVPIETDEEFLERVESGVCEQFNNIEDHQKRILFKMIALTAIDNINFSGIELNEEERERYHQLKGSYYRKKLKDEWHLLFNTNIPNEKEIIQIFSNLPGKFSQEQKEEYVRQLIDNILSQRLKRLKNSYKSKIRISINGVNYKNYYKKNKRNK